jgi:hypothetical protein
MSLSRSEQARLNGAKSHGPRTESGKARSAMNAARHGLSGERLVVLNNENDAAFRELFQSFLDKFRPEDAVEHEIVLQAAAARWRLRRIWQLETALFDAEMDNQAEQLTRQYVSFDEGTRQARAFAAMADNSGSLSLLNRYERSISREYERAMRALDRARAERKYRAEMEAQNVAPPAVAAGAESPVLVTTRIEKERNEPNGASAPVAAWPEPHPAGNPCAQDPPLPKAA